MADIFSDIAGAVTKPIGGAISGVARGLFPGAAKQADVRMESIARKKDMEQFGLYLNIMKDRTGTWSKEAKKAAADSMRRSPIFIQVQQRLGGAPVMGQQRDWWSGLTSSQTGGATEEGFVNPMATFGEPAITPTTTEPRRGLPSPFRVESIAGKPGEAEPTITLKPTAMSPADRQTFGTKLRTEFNTLSKDFRTIRDSYGRVLASTEDPSAAGDLALIFNYMKILDPGSVVRESEFANAAASGSLGQRWIAVGRKLLAGERLSPKMRADFADRAKRLFKSQKNIQSRLIKKYSGLAERSGISAKDVITEIEMKQQTEISNNKVSNAISEARRQLGTNATEQQILDLAQKIYLGQ